MKKEQKLQFICICLNKRGCQKFCVQMEIKTSSEYLVHFCWYLREPYTQTHVHQYTYEHKRQHKHENSNNMKVCNSF